MSVTTPFFSIITASYNSEATIKECIESVLNQSFNDFEYVLIDGNSSDNTVAIIRSFEEKFKERNIAYKWISEKDSGIYDAWNKGLDASTGNWISFLGSDDEYVSDALELYAAEIRKNPEANYISSRVDIIDENKHRIETMGKPFVWKKMARNMAIAQVGSFHKRELFEEVGSFSLKYRIVGDYDFYLRSKNHIRPVFFNRVTAKMSNGGVSNQIYKALKEALKVKLHNKTTSSLIGYYDFLLSLSKCYIKVLIKKK